MSATLAYPPDHWKHGCATLLAQWQTLWTEPVPVVDVAAPSDADCMQRYRNGDAQAFRVLYARHRDKLHRYVLRLADRASDAEEIFQDVWMAVIRGKDSYTPDAPFITWLFAIAHRRVADRWRTLARHAPEATHADDEGEAWLAQQASSAMHAPEQLAHSAALGKALLDAIRQLPLPQREAFLMRAEGGLSVDDIAFATGVNRETAKSRLRYAQQRLREAMATWR
ncbi:sigma-70 family RNA polymerase sigma factor [Dyella sp. ASV21]|uniref:sigma-70 family RNA polymerase sigma factor n=1 Tax=Dyella sp. ASV21 TaxID=2795114 RepID=UPI001E5651F3|nr:sigma-70 family RNA polymerase sigma factor [Dyella sp. ASV21]